MATKKTTKKGPKQKYSTLCNVRHDGCGYAKGKVISLTDDDAKHLLKQKAIAPYTGTEEPEAEECDEDEAGDDANAGS